jgi:hypothetical protein
MGDKFEGWYSPGGGKPLSDSVKVDWRRAALELPQHGSVSLDAIRAAYWRIVRQAHPSKGGDALEFERIRKAKQELLAEAGLRIPSLPQKRG